MSAFRPHPALLLAALGACTRAAAPSAPAPVAPRPTLTPIAEAAAFLDEHSSCHDMCCLRGGPAYLRIHGGGVLDPASLADARRLLSGPAPARMHALAALRVGAGMQLEDLPLLLGFLRSDEDAGELPVETPDWGQGAGPACIPSHWWAPRLGKVALVALGNLTGSGFKDAESFGTWRAAHADIEGSVDYWEGALAEAVGWPGGRHAEMVASLRARPEILARVALVTHWPDHIGASRDDVIRLVRETLTIPRLIRILDGAESPPEIAGPSGWSKGWWMSGVGESRFRVLVESVSDLAPDLADPRLAAALRHLWERRRFAVTAAEATERPGVERTDGLLAQSLVVLYPGEARRFVNESVGRVHGYGPEVLDAFIQRHLEREEEFLLTFFHEPRIHDVDLRNTILRSAASRGFAALPFLKRVAREGRIDDGKDATIALVRAVAAIDPSASCPRGDQIDPFYGKGHYPGAAELAEREKLARAARTECLRYARDWLARH